MLIRKQINNSPHENKNKGVRNRTKNKNKRTKNTEKTKPTRI